MEPVRSPRNPKVVEASRLHRARDRRETGRTLIEGPHLLAEALEGGFEIVRVFALDADSSSQAMAAQVGADLVVVERAVLDRLAGTETPRGPVAVLAVPRPVASVRDVVVTGVTDPGNAGTIVRTAAAFGFDVCPADGSVDLWAPKVLRSGAGAHFRTAITDEAAPSTIATVVAGGIDPARIGEVLDPDRRWSLLIGSEAHGLQPEVAASAEVAVTIPMPGGTESLNAAVAAAIVMYEVARWRARCSVAPGTSG